MFITLMRTTGGSILINAAHIAHVDTLNTGETRVTLSVEGFDKQGFRKSKTITVKETQASIAQALEARTAG